MFRNYLAAALRNLVRNKLYAAINVLGLAVGMAAAIVTGLYIRDELSFDFFIPGHDKLYVMTTAVSLSGSPDVLFATSPPQTGEWLAQDFPGTVATGLCSQSGFTPSLRHGDVESLEPVAWVDSRFFALLKMPVIAGDPVAALADRNNVVITRAVARKFFGRDTPLGEPLEIDRTTSLTVAAVIKDLPATTSISQRVFAGASSSAAPPSCAEDRPYPNKGEQLVLTTRTYVRLPTYAAATTIDRAMPDFVARNMGFGPDWPIHHGNSQPPRLTLVRLNDLHMTRFSPDSGFTPGNPMALLSLGLVAALTLLIASINFVNLMIARSAHRMVEVGIRKVSGAERRHLVAQFIGESVIYGLFGLVLAAASAGIALPGARSALGRPLGFAFWQDPTLLGCMLGLSVGLGVLAGAYPALVQSRFRPIIALKGAWPAGIGGVTIREALVMTQFVILISLILAVLVIARQTRFAMNEGLRVDKDRVMTMDIAPADFNKPHFGVASTTPLCRNAFVDEVRRLPGVRSAACSDASALDLEDHGGNCTFLASTGGQSRPIACGTVDIGFFELFGLRPVAGRFFSSAVPDDDSLFFPQFEGVAPQFSRRFLYSKNVVINQTAVRALGFSSADEAVGQFLKFDKSADGVTIIGVVPDFALSLLHGDIRPRFYALVAPRLDTLNIKLAGRDIPETIRAIDALWKKLGEPRAASHRFIDSYLQTAYINVLRQGLLVNILCGIAILIAALGLFGLSAFTAERRTKEIGVRKALGASRIDILRLLLWEFAKPVLWANVLAWPLAYVILHRWLESFTYRIALEPWMFLVASALALTIAVATVAGHALLVARSQPATALRYE